MTKIENLNGTIRKDINFVFFGKFLTVLVQKFKKKCKQECIPVGCIPPAAVAISPAMHGPTRHTPTMHAPPCTPLTMHAPHHAYPLPHMPPAMHTPTTHTAGRTCPLPCMPLTMHAPLPHTPPAMHTPLDRQTSVKTLPLQTSFAGGNNLICGQYFD